MIEKLSEQYKKIVSQYIDLFCEKQDLELEFWVADEVGEIACFGDHYYFNFTDIKQDLEKDAPKDEIINWLEATTDNSINNDNDFFINYNSWLMGARFEMLTSSK